MTDIEKTTITVKTFAIAMWTVLGLVISISVIGTASWIGVRDRLDSHTEQLQGVVTTAAATKADLDAKLQVILENQNDLKDSFGDLKRVQDATSKRLDDYRVYKWSTPMMEEENHEAERLNPNWKAPDAREIHDQIIPYTP